MSIRKIAAPRMGARVHYFVEGSEKTVCGLDITESFRVKSEDEPMSCRNCADELARVKRQEQAS